jgi:hypothetical protein
MCTRKLIERFPIITAFLSKHVLPAAVRYFNLATMFDFKAVELPNLPQMTASVEKWHKTRRLKPKI